MTRIQKGDEIRLKPNQNGAAIGPLKHGKTYVAGAVFGWGLDARVDIDGIAWYAHRFYKVDEEVALPKPKTRREIAEQYLKSAEARHVGRDNNTPTDLAALGILHLLLDEPKPEVESSEDRYKRQAIALGDRVDELVDEKSSLQERLDDSWSEREALRHRVDELTTEKEQLKEKADILESELLVAKSNERAAVADRAAACEEIDRLNREQGIVPTRAEAVTEVEGFMVTESGNSVEISDCDDTVRFERPIGGPSSFVFVAPTPEDGVYITRAQWDALTRKAEAWAEDNRDA